jgi:raffinose/stachyose/melibiose transport system substrate-binding protein
MLKRLTIFMIAFAAVVFTGCNKGAGSNGPVTIEFFQQKPEVTDLFKELISIFEKENPDIKVTQTTVPQAKQVLLSRMAAGNMPDVTSEYVNSPDFRIAVKDGRYYELTGKKCLENVIQSYLVPLKVNDKDYALPISVNTIGVMYNEDIFNKLGLKIPSTYEEFIQVCKKIKETGIVPISLSDRTDWTTAILAQDIIGQEMGKENADKFFADLAAGKVSAKDNAVMRKIATRFVELRGYGRKDSAAIDYDLATNNFATGKAAMFINGIWAIPSVTRANPKLKFKMFPFPASEGAKTSVIYGIDFAVAVSADTKHADAALKFAEFLSRKDIAQKFSDTDNSPSVIKGVSVKSDKITSNVKLIESGGAFEWLHFKWASGMETRFWSIAQLLATSKNVDQFLTKLDETFRSK